MIPFTQYVLPNGTAKPNNIESDEGTERKAHELIDEGYSFEVEILTNDVISMTCEDRKNEETLSIVLSENGPEIEGKLVELVNNAYVSDNRKQIGGRL